MIRPACPPAIRPGPHASSSRVVSEQPFRIAQNPWTGYTRGQDPDPGLAQNPVNSRSIAWRISLRASARWPKQGLIRVGNPRQLWNHRHQRMTLEAHDGSQPGHGMYPVALGRYRGTTTLVQVQRVLPTAHPTGREPPSSSLGSGFETPSRRPSEGSDSIAEHPLRFDPAVVGLDRLLVLLQPQFSLSRTHGACQRLLRHARQVQAQFFPKPQQIAIEAQVDGRLGASA